jgi:hypothetical protein
MRAFERGQSNEAMLYAAEGGQGLHVYPALGMNAPLCFKRSKQWAHLYDMDTKRLISTAKQLGVRVIVVHYRGHPNQHIDLCGGPLKKAMNSIQKEDHMKNPSQPKPRPKPPVTIPTCTQCGKPLTQCLCKENDLRK